MPDLKPHPLDDVDYVFTEEPESSLIVWVLLLIGLLAGLVAYGEHLWITPPQAVFSAPMLMDPSVHDGFPFALSSDASNLYIEEGWRVGCISVNYRQHTVVPNYANPACWPEGRRRK